MKTGITKFKLGLLAAVAMFVLCLCVTARLAGRDEPHFYIAHGGGAIEGHPVTNTLEAVDNAISRGVKYIELDLVTTSDGQLVAAHDWGTFAEQTGVEASAASPPAYDTFRRSRVYGKFKPMTAEMIDSVLRANPDIHLVTDKIQDMALVDKSLGDFRDRMLVECFSKEQYSECQRLGYTPMHSYRNLSPSGLHAVGLESKSFFLRHFLPRDYAVFSNQRISAHEADSIFNAEPRVKYIYVDFL
ncbi:MAG: glycerophosphodiester phosphodiesterase family protein [Muribaculaceae bacterium]|nr:glycerophosphodiester phosphodiesterase family protein [Muribaculaceae bacterium]